MTCLNIINDESSFFPDFDYRYGFTNVFPFFEIFSSAATILRLDKLTTLNERPIQIKLNSRIIL